MLDVFFCFALLASATMANAYCLRFLPLVIVAGLRMLVAGIILVIIFRKKSPRLKIAYLKQDIGLLLVISMLTMLIPALLKAYALKYLATSKAAFFGSLDPFVTAIYAYLFWNERLNIQKIIGICIGFSGILILLASRSSQEERHMLWWIISYPEIAAILAMAIGRLGWLLVQGLLKRDRYNAPEINGITMTLSGAATFIAPFFSALVLMILGMIGILNPLENPREYAVSFFSINVSQITNLPFLILALVHTIIVGNVIGYTLYSSFFKHHSATFISLAGFSVPMYIYSFDVLRGIEPFSFEFLAAALVTFTGLIIFYQGEIKKLLPAELFLKIHSFLSFKNQ